MQKGLKMIPVLEKGAATIYESHVDSIQIGFPRRKIVYYWADDEIELTPRLQGPFESDLEAMEDHAKQKRRFKSVYLG